MNGTSGYRDIDGINGGMVLSSMEENLTAVYHEMDRMIAHSTLPEKVSYRDEDFGKFVFLSLCSHIFQKLSMNCVNIYLFTIRNFQISLT